MKWLGGIRRLKTSWMQCLSSLSRRLRCQTRHLQALSEVLVFQAFLGTDGFPVSGWGKAAGTVPVSPCLYACQRRTARHWRVTKSHRNQPKYNHWSGCLCYSLTCFPSGAGVLELMQCCSLADFIPMSVAFRTLSFDPRNQVRNEWNKSLPLTSEQHRRFRLELFLQQPEICAFPKFNSDYRMCSTSACQQRNRDNFVGGEGKVRTESCDTGWAGRIFSSYHWSH